MQIDKFKYILRLLMIPSGLVAMYCICVGDIDTVSITNIIGLIILILLFISIVYLEKGEDDE